jgi:hypothetical protein
MRSELALLVWLSTAAAAAAPPRVELVERILAVVDERPLLLSDVRIHETLRGLSRPEALEAAIDARLMYQEAARLPQTAVPQEEQDRALATLLATRPELRTTVREADLRHVLLVEAVILKYVEFRFRPQVRVSPEAVRELYEQEHGAPADGAAFAEVEDELSARLERHDLDLQIETWIRELRARAEVRYVPGEGSSLDP